MRRLWEESGRFWMILLAGLALMSWMMPTQMALGQTLTVTIPNQNATLSRSTGNVTLTANVTCSEDATIDFIECSAEQRFGRTDAFADGEIDEDTPCVAGEITSITVILEPGFGSLKNGPTSVGCFACLLDFAFCDDGGRSLNLRSTR
jgi:hypothetical protein